MSQVNRCLRTVSLAALAACVLVPLCVPAHAATTLAPESTRVRPEASSAQRSAWRSPTPSATAAPRELASSVTRGEPARVVTVLASPHGPVVDTETTVGHTETRRVIAAAQQDPDLLAVGVDHKVRIASEDVRAARVDPRRGEQWALDLLDAESAWRTSQGRGVVVAIIDSGVDGSHPDLRAAMVRGVNTRTDSGDHSSPATDRAGHGTHVAGIVAARADNGLGVAGVAPQARIMPVKVLGADGTGWMSDVVEGIRWAVDHGASVINLSLGGTSADFMKAAVGHAVAQGVTVVAAAGNEDSNVPSYPAALPGVISVSALNPSGRLAEYSNYGATIDLAAPGTDVVSTVPGGYESMSGTSMATPHVAGVAALVSAISPASDVTSVLLRTARDLGLAGRDNRYGHGRIDPVAALRAVCTSGSCPYRPDPRLSRRKQTLQRVPAVRVGQRRRLPLATRQGVRISAWKATNHKCSVRRRTGRWEVRGRARGACRLLVTVGATRDYAALIGLAKVRVVGRKR